MRPPDREWGALGPAAAVVKPGDFVVRSLFGESVVVVGSDDGPRAFLNVCQHRGASLVTAPAGHLVRFQCPYHAWVYGLDGACTRAIDTAGLEDFEAPSLTAVSVTERDGELFGCLPSVGLRPGGRLPTRDELAPTLRPVASAAPLPGWLYTDEWLFEWEMPHVFGDAWMLLGRDATCDRMPPLAAHSILKTAPPTYDRDDVLAGSLLWTPAGLPPRAAEVFGDAVGLLERYSLALLESVERRVYTVAANWKIVVENFTECGHCPGVHPQLNRLTPYRSGHRIETSGDFVAGTMDLVGGARSLTLDGGDAAPARLPGLEDSTEVVYLRMHPSHMYALHPDYVLTFSLWPVAVDRTEVHCDWLFHPDAIACDAFDPSGAIGFWDETNRQDWEVCALTQRGLASSGFRGGRLTLEEEGLHRFACRIAETYLGA